MEIIPLADAPDVSDLPVVNTVGIIFANYKYVQDKRKVHPYLGSHAGCCSQCSAYP